MSYCTDELGLEYNCDKPTPRSALDPSGPLCASFAEFLYDPANCDPGYWCGCASTDLSLCVPSNDTSITRWGGHFTTTTASGEEIIFTGTFDGESNKCPSSYYCPGRDQPGRCVDLCEPSKVCADAGEMIPCPDGYYCPVGTIDPISCRALEVCAGDGLRRFEVSTAVAVLIVVLMACIAYLFGGRYYLNRIAKRKKEERMEMLRSKVETATEDGAPHDDSEGAFIEKNYDHLIAEQQTKPPSSTIMGKRRRSSLAAPEMTVDIEFERLSLTIPNVGTIMRGVSGKLQHGSLTAIMGPSGAGKTTFLNIMSGKLDRSAGVLRVNGKESELTSFRNIIGFVPQEDIMLRELTVEEIVKHSAFMRLPSAWSNAKKLAQVDDILEALEIDHIRDVVVGDERRRGISGGQRKRVNIAMEMVTKPSLLCLDEPTSGLDSTTSLSVIESLKDMANTGANIITVLHQPKYEIFELFDQVLLLGQGGMTVYSGKTEYMSNYFEKQGFSCPSKANPADYYMDVLSGVVPHATNPKFDKEDLFEAWMIAEENPDAVSPEEARAQMEKMRARKSAEESEKVRKGVVARVYHGVKAHLTSLVDHLGRDFKRGETSRKTPGRWKQSQLLFKRAVLQRLRTPYSTVLNIILMAIAGAVLPSLVPDDANLYVGIPKSLTENEDTEAYLRQNVRPVDEIPGILLNIYIFMLMVSCLSVNVLGGERTVFFRDTSTGQFVSSYWLAKTMETLMWLPVFTASFVLLGYSSEAWLLQPLGRYYTFLLFDLVGFYGIGIVASLLVGSGSAALLALVFGIIVAILFSGVVNAFGDASQSYQNFISAWFLFWSTQGMCSEEYDQYRYAFDVDRLNDETPDRLDSDFGLGEQSVGAGVGMGFDLSSSFARNAVFCALTALVWHLVVLWTLKTKDHKKHR